MKRLFDAFIQEQWSRLSSCPAGSLLSPQAFFHVREMMEKLVAHVAESTVNHWVAQEALTENPLAAYTIELITADQRERAMDRIEKKLARGEMALPGPLAQIITKRLAYVTDSLLEMLFRLEEKREEICFSLGWTQPFALIEDMVLSAGDTHNRGRCVTILFTDAGKLVYKPRDMRLEACLYALVQRHFAHVLGIPRCVSFLDQWGVSEFIEKQRSQGMEEAALFWRRMGGAAAVMKLLGSTDMHIENLTCHGGKPYLLDLETALSPENGNADYKKLHPELSALKSTSLYLSCLLPSEYLGRQYSPLLNAEEEGCAPAAEGKNLPVTLFLDPFLSGYDEVYRYIQKKKAALRRELESLPKDMPVRLLVRSTQVYEDARKKLYHFSALESEEKQAESHALLARIMKKKSRSDFCGAVESEVNQLLQGDIPYIYTLTGSRNLFSRGERVAENVFHRTPLQHALDNLEAMSQEDEAFDMALLRRALLQYPAKLEKEEDSLPQRTDVPITKEQAIQEAREFMRILKEICIFSPKGTPYFGYINEADYSFRFCDCGLVNGLTGIAVFAAGCAMIFGQEKEKAFADKIVDTALDGLKRQNAYLSEKEGDWDYAPNLGEAEGIGGILTGLALLKRYTGRRDISDFQESALQTLSLFDLSRYGAPDRMNGMAGLLSALCRFPEYQEKKELIQRAADSLLSMKTLPHKDFPLWKTLPHKNRAISGGGHGLAGIAEALYAAASVLQKAAYARAAEDAIAFEIEAYSKEYGTWKDFRSYPPTGYMHGYCSGAPGIGIMTRRIQDRGFESGKLSQCAMLARAAVDMLPLNERDHLCCGNAAIAEYYLAMGERDEAGRVLSGMAQWKKQTGSYRYMSGGYQNSVTGSLFYGVSGVGYEMLRFASPENILPVI